ncbi:MAG: DUF4395 domain-containing protein [Candidatus Promineifilaceae bacterium]|nr:DUF4395 domain-containing protein [Candidatus Promineifilaceae bacterium]
MKNERDGRRVDHTALKVNQAFIIGLLIVAFLLSSWWLVALVAAVMILGTAAPQLALFKQIYRRLLLPAGLLQARVVPDNPEPHRFAQGFGGVVLALALLALAASQVVVGWALVWLVVALAALNLFVGFCAGCFLYYQLSQLGVPGFDRRPLSQG